MPALSLEFWGGFFALVIVLGPWALCEAVKADAGVRPNPAPWLLFWGGTGLLFLRWGMF